MNILLLLTLIAVAAIIGLRMHESGCYEQQLMDELHELEANKVTIRRVR